MPSEPPSLPPPLPPPPGLSPPPPRFSFRPQDPSALFQTRFIRISSQTLLRLMSPRVFELIIRFPFVARRAPFLHPQIRFGENNSRCNSRYVIACYLAHAILFCYLLDNMRDTQGAKMSIFFLYGRLYGIIIKISRDKKTV